MQQGWGGGPRTGKAFAAHSAALMSPRACGRGCGRLCGHGQHARQIRDRACCHASSACDLKDVGTGCTSLPGMETWALRAERQGLQLDSLLLALDLYLFFHVIWRASLLSCTPAPSAPHGCRSQSLRQAHPTSLAWNAGSCVLLSPCSLLGQRQRRLLLPSPTQCRQALVLNGCAAVHTHARRRAQQAA